MGATAVGCFATERECDRWARDQMALATRLCMFVTRDFGNYPVVRVYGFDRFGAPAMEPISLRPRSTLDDRMGVWLKDLEELFGWRVDPLRPQEEGWLRCIRFDS